MWFNPLPSVLDFDNVILNMKDEDLRLTIASQGTNSLLKYLLLFRFHKIYAWPPSRIISDSVTD